MAELGKIEVLSMRKQWENEEHNFTPWLRDNISYLSEVVGIDIEIDEIEKNVGHYELDMLGHIEGTNEIVVIENQLTSSDHKHLGQLLTYGAGLDATISIWVTPFINDEHKQAIEWLNAISVDQKSFFLVRPELIRIDDSKPAVRFFLEAGPSSFGRTIRAIVDKNTPRHQFRKEFWQGLLDQLCNHKRPWAKNRSTTSDSWMTFSSGHKDISVGVSMAMKERLRVEIGFTSRDKVTNKENFQRYKDKKEVIDQKLDSKAKFELLEDKIMSRIAVYKKYDKQKALDDQDYREELYKWYETMLETMYEIVNEIK